MRNPLVDGSWRVTDAAAGADIEAMHGELGDTTSAGVGRPPTEYRLVRNRAGRRKESTIVAPFETTGMRTSERDQHEPGGTAERLMAVAGKYAVDKSKR